MGKVFSDRLIQARRSSGFKAKQLALECGISAAYLSQLETGKRSSPDISLVNLLAKKLSVSVDWLIGKDVPEKINEEPATYLTKKDLKIVDLERQLDRANETIHYLSKLLAEGRKNVTPVTGAIIGTDKTA